MGALPPLNALRAFEATGRNLSITRAAHELCVTHGAVSKQLKSLERHLGMALITRRQGRLALTPEGRALQERLSKAFDGLSSAVRHVRSGQVAGRVTVVCMPAFATHWLIPKLGHFNARYGDVTLTIVPSGGDDPFRDARVDMAILFGQPRWKDVNIQLLKQMEFFPVCSPVLLNGPKKIRRSSDLLGHRLLDDPEWSHWRDWFSQWKQKQPRHARRLCFTDFNHNIAAARAGLGVAMGDNVTVAADLQKGTLVRPLRDVLRPKEEAYYILTPLGGPVSEPAQAFIDWLTGEAAKNEVPAPSA